MHTELFNVSFESHRLPPGWVELNRRYRFERGGLRSGSNTTVRLHAPGHWSRLKVLVDLEPIGGAIVSCGDGTLTTTIDLTHGRHRISFYGPQVLATNRRPVESGRHTVTFETTDGRLRGLVDGTEVIAATDPSPAPAGGLLTLGFHDDCLVHRVRIVGDQPLNHPAPPPRRSGSFGLQVAIDFVDDLIAAPFTRDMLHQLFAEYASWGVQSVQWVYYGKRSDGWWDHAGNAAENARRTMDTLGEIFPAAVEAAHANGLAIHALLKPFDMGFYYSFGHGMPQAAALGKLDRIGGPKPWVASFPATRRDLIMARKPGTYGPAVNSSFTRIDLVKDDAEPAAFGVGDVQLFVSDDNTTYRAYDGPIAREEVIEDYPVWEHTASGGRASGESRRCRVMRLQGLHLEQPFLAMTVPGRAGSFVNPLVNLVHVFGPAGEERRLTYGLLTRNLKHLTGHDTPVDFRTVGVEFDVAPASAPSAVYPGYDFVRFPRALDSGEGLLAIAPGKEPGPIGALSPSFQQSRDFWLGWLRDALEAGADGIELRVRSHNYNLSWGEFGFEPPVVEAFRQRYGVDLLATDDFDHAAWRRLRGEGYTHFLRQAHELAAGYGRPMGLHVSPTLEMDPAIGAAMDIHWDWRTWLEAGLADSVTLKEIWPESRLGREVMSRTRRLGIPTIFSPFALTLFRGDGGPAAVEQLIRLAREHGCDGFQLYESAAVMRASHDGRVTLQHPGLRDVFRKNTS